MIKVTTYVHKKISKTNNDVIKVLQDSIMELNCFFLMYCFYIIFKEHKNQKLRYHVFSSYLVSIKV